MRALNEQWIEEIDGKKHMLKAVEGPCERCDISHTCNLSADCHMERGLIAKDLGPVNEDGLLPCPFCREYLDIIEWPNGFYLKHKDKPDCILGVTNSFPTKQECIDAWNRRTM